MAGFRNSTRDQILNVTRKQMMTRGMSRLTLQGVADELELSKQAILYWFPNKTALLQELFIEALETEAAVLLEAVQSAENAPEAVENFLRKGLQYHKENLPKFRLSYLYAQVHASVSELSRGGDFDRIYRATTRLYDALEEAFTEHPTFPEAVHPRNFAVSLHMTLLGHVCILGSMEAVGDTFKQSFEEMIDAQVAMLQAAL